MTRTLTYPLTHNPERDRLAEHLPNAIAQGNEIGDAWIKETNTQILSLYRTFRMSDIQLLSREFGWYFLTFTYMKNLTTVTVEITSPIVNKTPSLKNWIFEGKRNVNNTHL